MGLDFFRQASWLGAARVRGYLRLLALLNTAALALLLATSHDGIDRNGFLIGTDFLSFWTAGTMLQAQGNVYDAAAHAAAQRAFFAQDGFYTAFFYPPPFLLFCYPLGLLPYFPALSLWLATTGAAFLIAARQWLRRVGLAQPIWILFAAFPPVLITITHGQTSFLTAALLGLGTLLVLERPLLAGALIGMAVIKPQFGLLVPLVLLLTGQWRTVAAAGATVALLGLAATAAFGPGIWRDWLEVGSTAQLVMDQGVVGFAKMQSLFAAAMLLGAPIGVAYALQAALTLAVAGALAWASWRRRYNLALAAAMLTGALLVTPFVLDYDMVLLAFPLIYMTASGFRPWEKLVCLLTFIAPTFARPLAMEAGIPIMPLVLAALFVLLLRRALEGGSTKKAEMAGPEPTT